MHTASNLLRWITDHAVVILAVSGTLTIAGDQLAAFLRRRSDVQGSVTSVAGGAAYLLAKAIVSKGLMLSVALAVYDHRVFDLDWTNPIVWLGIFVARDLGSYWIHRAEHRVRILWASHLVHHSIERFTFTSAVRLPWMESLYKPVLVLWVPLVGFHPAAFAAMGAVVLLVGQLQHTELGRRRTVLDLVFVTPSAHRVHHGSNPEYLDKNFGSMLVVWDRLFGTYAPETVPVRYGLAGGKRITTPTQTLAGGYPALAAAVRQQPTFAARTRYLVAAP
ncbi:MAG TPA: sterol desaturase family protein [Acidimicrobiales bacterium]|nr:sterol desaturase family protein [Acidimicrobiales bacterium]